MYFLYNRTFIFRLILFIVLTIFVISACGGAGGGIPGVTTWTPSPSFTPTCSPNITLSTPLGANVYSSFFIILFDPNSNNENDLEYTNGEKTQSVIDFVNHIITTISQPSDQISVFQLGYRKYENARYLRIFSYTELPEIYNTPSPNETLTPIPVLNTGATGMAVIQETNIAGHTQTAHVATDTAFFNQTNCLKELYNREAKGTATSWAETQIAEVISIETNVSSAATTIIDPIRILETPYATNVVYEGLYHASVDISSDCLKYSRCILIIIDDLSTWTNENVGNFDINLTGVSLIYSIMPNCKDINQPSCKQLQDFWTEEFEKYGETEIVFANGLRAEENLLEVLRR